MYVVKRRAVNARQMNWRKDLRVPSSLLTNAEVLELGVKTDTMLDELINQQLPGILAKHASDKNDVKVGPSS